MRLALYWSVFLRMLRKFPEPRVILNYLRFRVSRWAGHTRLRHYPVSLVISTTKRCNLACEFCFVEKYMADSPGFAGDLTEAQYQALLNSPAGRHALRVGFLGGEPFLNKHIFRFIEDLHRRRKVTTVVTNSTILKGPLLEKLRASPLDALGLSLYDNNRDDIRRVTTALQGRIRFWIQTIVSSDTIAKMEPAIEFALSVGCPGLIFDNYFPKTPERLPKTLFDDNQEYLAERTRLRRKYGRAIQITWVPLISRAEPTVRSCRLPMSYAQIDNEGNIGPCCVRYPEKKYGNILEKDGWNSPGLVAIRRSLTDPRTAIDPTCRNCQCLTEDLYQV